MSDLAQRKRVLLLQAELQRQMIDLERFRLQQRLDFVRDRVRANRWWVMGGALALGLLSTRKLKLGSLFRLLPAGLSALRVMQNLKSR